jgi:hypothetical protein
MDITKVLTILLDRHDLPIILVSAVFWSSFGLCVLTSLAFEQGSTIYEVLMPIGGTGIIVSSIGILKLSFSNFFLLLHAHASHGTLLHSLNFSIN